MSRSDPVSAIFLKGRLCYLRTLALADLTDRMPAFAADRDVVRYLVRGTYPLLPEQARAEYEKMIDSREEVQFAVCDSSDDLFLGAAGLHSLNWIARHGEFRILLGAKERWGKGIGTEALRLLLAYGFEVLNLEKIWLGVNARNARAARSYERAGFVAEGRLRQEVYRGGAYHDVLRYSLLRKEYEQLKPKWEIAALLSDQLRA